MITALLVYTQHRKERCMFSIIVALTSGMWFTIVVGGAGILLIRKKVQAYEKYADKVWDDMTKDQSTEADKSPEEAHHG